MQSHRPNPTILTFELRRVFDIWESQAAFEAFGATLLPILTAAGIELNEPMVARVHNEIKG